jgi:hypothetical protein
LKFRRQFTRNKHQAEFDNDITSRLLHLSTGFGGGKTYALCKKLLKLSYLNAPHHGGLVVPSYADFKKDVLPEFELMLEKDNIKYRYHQNDKYFKFPWSKGKLFVVTAEKKIRGPNWAYAGINEVTLIDLTTYKEVVGRVRVKGAKFPQVASVGTPEGFASDYYEYFIEKPPKNFRMIYGSTKDNLLNLNEEYINLLYDSYDEVMQQTYVEGQWINMAGNRFYYSYDPRKNEDLNLKLNDFDQFYISMDFNVDPFCATVWGFDGYSLYGIGQIELAGAQGYNTENMCAAMLARGFVPGNTTIFPDPAGKARSTKGPPDVKILRDHGYNVRVKSAAPSFRTRQLNVNNLLDKGRIKFNPKLCPGIKKDLTAVEQDIISLEKVKANPKLTHYSDGLDYMCDILFPFSGNPKATRVEKYR